MPKEEFSDQNSHAENVKISIDKIIGQQTNTKRLKKSEEDRKKAAFCRVIDKLIMAEERQIVLLEVHSIDLTAYNNIFYEIVDDLFSLAFNKEQLNVINFFLYDRYSANGQKLNLLNEKGRPIKLETSADLWEALKPLK